MSINQPIRAYDPNDAEVLPGLLQSQCGTMDEPTFRSRAVPLDAFRLTPKWNNNRHYLFALMMMAASFERRINAGHSGLMVEAAKTIVRFTYPEVSKIYRERGVVLMLPDGALTEIANEYAAEMAGSDELRQQVREMLSIYRQLVVDDRAFSAIDAMFSEYEEQKSSLGTMNMWRDYVELLLKQSPNRVLFHLRRLISSCLRVHDAVFHG